MKKALFSRKFKTLEYWNSRNTTIAIQCNSYIQALKVVKHSGIEQFIEQI